MGKELSDSFERFRGIERLLGKTHDELMELGRNPQRPILNKKNSKKIGYSIYNPQDKTIKFVYLPKYRLIRFINRTHSKLRNYFSKN